MDVSKDFGKLVFNDKVMKAMLSKEVYESLKKTIDEGVALVGDLYDLKSKKVIEGNEKSNTLSFLYNTLFGRLILKVLTMKWVTNLGAWYMNSSFSKRRSL